ncbi:trans-acting regulatory protein hvrA [Salipiger profundus]|nr:trans-acting regulatory protein hvrA [Salipiger profundus]
MDDPKQRGTKMNSNIDLLEMDRQELTELSKKISKAIESYDARQKAKALAAAQASAKEYGYSLSELVGPGGVKGSKGAPKYAHPENSARTWTGKGRKPKWVNEHLSKGGILNELAIDA